MQPVQKNAFHLCSAQNLLISMAKTGNQSQSGYLTSKANKNKMNASSHLTKRRELKLKSDCFLHCFLHWGPGKGLRVGSVPLRCPSLLPFSPPTSSSLHFKVFLFFFFQIAVLFYKVLIPGFSWIVVISVERLSQQKCHPHLYTYKYISFLLLSCSIRALWSYLV